MNLIGLKLLANQVAKKKEEVSYSYENFDIKDIGKFDNGSMDGVKASIWEIGLPVIIILFMAFLVVLIYVGAKKLIEQNW